MEELEKREQWNKAGICGMEGKALNRGEWDVWLPVLAEISRLTEKKDNAVVAIDGRCGSGKTRLAGLLGSLFPCNVVHMDDFYLPFSMRPEDWQQIPGGNMDFGRLREELLHPLGEGRRALYRPYCCAREEMGDAVWLEPRPLTVVEGSYSQHPSLGERYDLTIFLTCSKEVQRSRLLLREGEGFGAFERRWIPMEETYFRLFGVEGKSGLRVDTSSR